MPQLLKSQIKPLRKSKHLTQLELAEMTNLCRATVISWENSRTKASFLQQFSRLCDALNCNHVAFLRELPNLNEEPADNLLSLRKKLSNSEPLYNHSLIKKLRNEKNISQENLAEMVGVDPNTVQNWENSQTAMERHRIIAVFCEILECKHSEIFILIDIEEDISMDKRDTLIKEEEEEEEEERNSDRNSLNEEHNED